jgi:O-methyltransferase
MTFYGIPKEEQGEALNLSLEIVALFKKYDRPIIHADNMLLALRETSFMNDEYFASAIRKYCFDSENEVIIDNMAKFWRLHIYTWCCDQAMRLDGSLVECGVHMGLYSLTMMRSLNFANSGKEMYLYDTFEGLADGQASEQERATVADIYDIPNWEADVRDSFSGYPEAYIIRGTIPDILKEKAPQAVSFLHLDLNSHIAEKSAFEFFQPRLVPGAFILLDDFGRTEYKEMNIMYNEMFAALGHRILELPTGQGLVIWN